MSIRLVTLGKLRVLQDGGELTALPGQPVRSALLIYLAVEGTTTRDRLLDVLWPEKDDAKARSALSSTLYELGRTLDHPWREGSGDILRTTGIVSSDAGDFVRAVERGDHKQALSLYSGAFLEGTHLVGTRGFEGWVEQTRAYLARLHREARSEYVSDRIEGGALKAALNAALDWTELEPLEDEAHHRCMELLARTGRPAEAIRLFERFRDRLMEELELEPMEQMVSLVDRIRSGEIVGPTPTINASASYAGRSTIDPPSISEGRLSKIDSAPPMKATEPPVVVLPFLNMSPDPENEYFSDGMTEELISALSRLDGLRVAAATTSFALKNTSYDVQQIRDLLGVEWLVEGSVRKFGTGLRISARLVDARDGFELWSDRYERELKDVLRLQDEIARSIADSLGPRLEQKRWRGGKVQTADPKAYDLYLMGRYFYAQRSREGLERAVQYFREAIAHDPDYALAHSGLADAYMAQAHFQYRPPLEVMPEAQAANRRALEIDPSLAEAHCSEGHIEDTFGWGWKKAERSYRKAIELDPDYAHARICYGDLLTRLGRHDEAIAQGDQAEILEPLSVPIKFQKGTQLYRARRFPDALGVLQRAIEMDPTYFPAQGFYALTLTAMDRGDQAVSAIEEAVQNYGPHPVFLVVRGFSLARIGRDSEAREIVHMLEDARDNRYVPALLPALIHGALGERDQAFEGLGHALDERYAQLTFLAVDPLYDPVRDDPRFEGLLDRLDLERRG